jgi:hypothetical protein
VEHTEHGDGATDIAGISGKAHEGRGSRPDENGVENPLMGAEEPMELLRHGKDEMKVGNSKKLSPPLIEPLFGIAPVALGTASVSAGMVGVTPQPAVVADGKMAAQGLGAALGKVSERTLMAGKHRRAEALKVLGAEAPEDICDLWHDLLWVLLQVSHEVVDDTLEVRDGFSGEMGIPEGGCKTAMAEHLLDEADIHASLQKMGCVGVPQGMDVAKLGSTLHY